MTALRDALAALMPAGVAVAGGRIADLQAPLWPGEDLPHARSARLAEFTAGRTAARMAMAALGLPPAALPAGPDRAPLWPAGITGSISHSGDHALAAVARTDTLRAIGIDIEGDAPLDPALLPEIAAADEVRAIAPQDMVRLFSAKEAAFKAQSARGGGMIGFHDMLVTLTAAGFAAVLRVPSGDLPAGLRLSGRQARADGLILSVAVIGNSLSPALTASSVEGAPPFG